MNVLTLYKKQLINERSVATQGSFSSITLLLWEGMCEDVCVPITLSLNCVNTKKLLVLLHVTFDDVSHKVIL